MKKDLLPALRKELENSFGRKILSSRDCLQMVEDIYQKTGYSINGNTLRRFFGLVKTAYSASPSTLTILSKYCGFNSIDEIEKISAGTPTEQNINAEEILHYLISLFKGLPITKEHNDVVESLVQQTVIFLERNPLLIDRFQREIAKTIPGQYYYYELSVNMDRLNDYYGNSLRYYLRAKDTDEGRAFANSLLIFRHWLTGNHPQLEKHMTQLSELSINTSYPSHILGRVIAARIYHAQASGESTDRILIDATKYHVAVMAARSLSTPVIPHYELAVCEALILVGQYDEAHEFIRRGKLFLASFKQPALKNPFGLWETIISSKNSLNTIKPAQNHFLSTEHIPNYYINKKYNSILRTFPFRRNKSKQLESMIHETGFVKFNSLSNNH